MMPRLSLTPRGLALILVAWTVVAALIAAAYRLPDASFGFWSSLFHFLPFYWIWALLTPPTLAILARVRGGHPPLLVTLSALVALGVATAIVQIALYIPLEISLHQEAFFQPMTVAIAAGVRRHLPGNLLTFAGLAAVYFADDYRVRTADELTRAKLEVLRGQLQPHFLFNSLQTVSSLMHSDPAAAEDVLEQLGDFLRLVLRRRDREVVPVSEEIELLDRYAAIMRARFGARVRITIDVDPTVRSALVPVMILQPLVENAITHGIADRAAGGEVIVAVRRDNANLSIVVEDDGTGMSPTATEGIGLENTRLRIAALHPDAHSLRVSARPGGGTRLVLSFPLQSADALQAQLADHGVMRPRTETA